MLKQDLIDRLVIAVEQQDVLYCLVWLSEMKEKKPLNLVDSKREFLPNLLECYVELI